MQVFKAFFKILYKNKMTLFLYIGIYLALTLLICKLMGTEGEMEFSNVSLDISVENRDQGELGEALVDYLGIHNHLKDVPEGREALQDAMYYEEIDYVLVIPEDFTRQFLKGDSEGLLEGTIVPGSSTSYLLENEVENFLKTAAMYLRSGVTMEQAMEWTRKDMEEKPEVRFLEQTAGQQLSDRYYFFQYIPYVYLILMILGVGAVVKSFKNKDLEARNKCSSMSFLKQNLQIFLGCMVYMLVMNMIFLLMAVLNTGEDMLSLQGFLSGMNAVVFSLCALSVAWFVAQFARNTAVLNMMSNIFGLGFSFLGGVFVSLEFMGEGARQAAKFTPSYWYVIANYDIQKVKDLAEAGTVYQSFRMVLVFAAAFFAAGLLVNRMQIRSR
ncbi:MAG: ABC transporter permease [Lachnospiraceae bacterium]|nr:ABC transporter permease [Lachnospiraceae bacterium]